MLTRDSVSSEQLGHLGVISATIKELGLIERIDARHKQSKASDCY